MKLVPNWKKAYKMVSMWAMSVALALQGAWTALPADMLSSMNPTVMHIATGVLLVFGMVGRLVVQESVAPSDDSQDK